MSPQISRRRIVSTIAVAALAAGGVIAAGASAATPTAAACTQRVLIIGAMPSEIGVPLAKTTVEKIVQVGIRRYYVGKLAGNNVILAMSGIGLVNAEQTATTAFQAFRCGSTKGISATVFTGVSGGPTLIGDVMVPSKWRRSGNADAIDVPVDPAMYTVAKAAATTVTLESKAPTGD